jgi:2-keto-4-pentenoate hydratase
MTDSQANDAGAYLAAQRHASAELAHAFPEALRPLDWAAVSAIQLATMARIGPIGGWKVGAHDATAVPIGSPLPSGGIVGSPATVSSRFRGVECEIGFRIGRALPARTDPYGESDILAAIESCNATIEIVSARFHNHPNLDKLSLAADLGAHDGLCVGAPVASWTPEMFASLAVTMTIDGVVRKEAVGSNPGGTNLVRLLVWLANSDLVRAAGGIEAGAVITTGSWTGLTFTAPGSTITAQFAGFPPVEVAFAEG